MVNKTIIKRPKDISLRTDELLHIFRASESLTEAVEDVLERQALYSPDFLRGLNVSLKEVKQGNMQKIVSFADLS